MTWGTRLKYGIVGLTLLGVAAIVVSVGPDTQPKAAPAAAGGNLVETIGRLAEGLIPDPTAPPRDETSDATPDAARAVEIALARGAELRARRNGTLPTPTASATPQTGSPGASASTDAPPAPDTPADGGTGGTIRRVTGSTVNLRAGPGTEHPVIAQAGQNDPLVAFGPQDGEWVEVRLSDGRSAWIFATLLGPPEG